MLMLLLTQSLLMAMERLLYEIQIPLLEQVQRWLLVVPLVSHLKLAEW